jgi:hypothetical protein
MKKLLLIISLLGFAFSSTAQNQPQVPNGDFENWKSFTPCVGIDSLVNYFTVDIASYYKTNICTTSPSVLKTSDAYSGTYALKIVPFALIFPGTQIPIVYEGNYVELSNTSEITNSSLPFTGKPKKLIGYYKFNNAGTDTMGIFIATSSKDSKQAPILYGEFTAKTSTSSFTKFEINLQDFDMTNQYTTDSLAIYISLNNINATHINANSYIIIDALTFEYGTATATTNYSSTSSINVFAANKNINFSDKVSDVHVVDMTGVNALQETASTQQVNVGNLKNGLYVVTFKYNDNYFSKKIVLE